MTLPRTCATSRPRSRATPRSTGSTSSRSIFEVLSYKQMNEVAAVRRLPDALSALALRHGLRGAGQGYEYGLQKIYEMVINNNPSYAYLLEGNSIVDQKTVMAHVFAHVDFFKNNYFFSKTNRRMIDGMATTRRGCASTSSATASTRSRPSSTSA
jgi:stage V sporulation protein R